MPTERTDLFASTCYVGQHASLQSPDAFRKSFCALCRNPACSNSLVAGSKWQHRMDTQEDRLLINPQFGDPTDPRFSDLLQQDFKDRVREVMALEISSAKGDWEPVTDAEVDAAMVNLSKNGVAPAGFLADKPQPEMLWEGQARGTGGTIYRLMLMRIEGQDVWSCSCPAFEHRRGQCKHIQEAIAVRNQTETPAKAAVAVPVKPPNTTPATLEKWRQATEQGRVPRSKNTSFPAAGMMIDGSPPPPPVAPPDPWAVPIPSADPIVPIGGKFVLGGGPKKEGT